jgi:hypothetical protein
MILAFSSGTRMTRIYLIGLFIPPRRDQLNQLINQPNLINQSVEICANQYPNYFEELN